MRKYYYLLFLLAFIPVLSFAQPWHAVNVASGTQNVGGITVTVTPNNNPGVGSILCPAGLAYPYLIGNNGQSNSYTYSFSTKVSQVRLRLGDIGAGEIVRVTVGSTHYQFSNSDITSYPEVCVPVLPKANSDGDITNNIASVAYGLVLVKPAGGIPSIKVEHLNGLTTGTFYDLAFILDTPITFKHPFTDTMLCAGSKFDLKYVVNATFSGSNTFTAQLSDASGSFSNPKNLGTVNSNATGSIPCKVPANTPSGTGYRIRIISTSPVFTAISPVPVRIDRFALPPYASAPKDSFCEGETLHLETKYFTPGVTIDWTGPAGFHDTAINPVKEGLQVEDSGDFYFMASIGACHAYDTIGIRVYINPPIDSVTNNGPLCEEDTLRIQLYDSASLPITYYWQGPNGFTDTVQNPVIKNVTDDYTGVFQVWSKLGFCQSTTSTNVQINTKPDIPAVTNNGPLFPGKELRLDGSSPTPGVTYSWTGPDGFTSNLPNPVIPFVPVEAAGAYKLIVSLGDCYRSAITVVDIQNPTKAIINMGPNPVTNCTFHVDGIAVRDQTIPYVLFDLGGHKLHEGKFDTKRRLIDETITIPCYLPNGQYYLKMRVDGDFKTYSITIMR